MTFQLRFLASAEQELRETAHWYDSHSDGTGVRFRACIADAMSAIATSPLSFRCLPSEPTVRSALVKHFPYAVIFSIEAEHILVLAIAHTRRQPGYWSR